MQLQNLRIYTANENAKRIIKMGEDKSTVFNVGCPRIDLVAEELKNSKEFLLKENKMLKNYKGVGNFIDLNNPLLVSQHPVTTEFGSGRWQIEQTLGALKFGNAYNYFVAKC